ncbi:MAG: hypothetical protein C4528_01540 [Gammaproteobacteria bacterium]|nr:MAG: hypothetical protein C4528_01540 [Gammaproteobacteria bacterium]
MTSYFISPSFTHEKLDAPSYADLLDVFEDRMRHWLLEPAKQLLNKMPHGDGTVPAVALSIGYFEGIEIYCSGEDSNGRSKEFFRRGFKRVFTPDPAGAHVFDEVVNALYVQARCGFVHDGLFRNRVFFSDVRAEPLTVTWPRRDGQFVKDGHLESVIINPALFCASIEKHFSKYMFDLRAETDPTLKTNFQAAVSLKWGLSEADRIIGMTERDFHGEA